VNTPLLQTPLFETHQAANARLVPFAGWEMPVQYTGVLDEVKAVREKVGLFDVSHMGRVRVTGAGSLDYLQSLAVSDVSLLPEAGGSGQYSLLCLDNGGVIDDIIIYRLAQDEFIVVVNASNREKDLQWMRNHSAAFDVTLDDETNASGLIAVQGPNAVRMIDSLSDQELRLLPRFGLNETVLAGSQVMAARTGYTGEDGFELFCRADEAESLWNALVAAGGRPCGLGSRDTLRLEAGLPLYGHEMDETVSPYEARLGWTVKLEKPMDFSGKKALQDMKATPRRKTLVGLEMEGRAIPREGYAVQTPDGTLVGSITSGTFSPMRQKGVAMARVDSANATRGNNLQVVIRDTPHPARIVGLPFYKNV